MTNQDAITYTESIATLTPNADPQPCTRGELTLPDGQKIASLVLGTGPHTRAAIKEAITSLHPEATNEGAP